MSNFNIVRFIHYILAFLWIYQGIFPKLWFTSKDEIAMWQFMGLSHEIAVICGKLGGIAEIIFGTLFIIWGNRLLHYLNLLAMVGLFIVAAVILPQSLIAAFNPVVMNIAMGSLSIIALSLMENKSS